MAEVLIASVLLAFVVMTSLTVLSRAYGFSQHARKVTTSGQAAQSVMEDLRLCTFAQLKAYASQSQPVNFSSILTSEKLNSNFTQGMSVSGTFTTLVASSGSQLGKIAVTVDVTWREQNLPFSRKFTTYFGEKGLSDKFYVGWAP